MFKEKTSQAVEILNELKLDLWLTFVRETDSLHDPCLDFLYPGKLTWQSALMISSDGEKTAIVGNLDSAAVEQSGIFDKVVPYTLGVKNELLSCLMQKDPKKIAVNYSMNNEMSDGLTHGMFLLLHDILKETPYKDRLVSAENLVSALRGRKTQEELRRLRESARITSEIFNKVSHYMKPGMTEKEVAAFILERVRELKLETSWEESSCPSVFTGPDTAGAHFDPTDRKIERGHIVNMDFGVKKDDYVSDMQRTWYVLREGEDEAPGNVQKGFSVLRESISLAALAIKPGVEGRSIDAIARNHIVQNGYDEYPHALGHQVGRAAHDGAGLLCPEWERYADKPYMKLEKGQVYTIEPRLTVKNHGVVTMEEEIVVTEDGCEFLTQPQEELYLIK